ncbi:MAG: biotin synthase [Rhodoferax sp.]
MPPHPSQRPPTLDAVAAARWEALAAAPSNTASPWLHEEVARRMEERLQWIVKKPARWMHWEPLRGGINIHARLAQRYPQAQCCVVQTPARAIPGVRRALSPPWWDLRRWRSPGLRFDTDGQLFQMLWANMALHMDADPQSLIARWHSMLEPDGFLMFSCFGPDTLRELRSLYTALAWPAPAHEFTDMHDWGDMLVQAGFAEPVMDMERITLTFSSSAHLLAELRGLGRNLHVQRFAGLRGRRWHADLQERITQGLADPAGGGRLRLQFEIIYGHAFKPQPRITMRPQTSVSLDDFRAALRNGSTAETKD